MSPAAAPDVERLRADTPGCAERVHLNNAGAALPPAVVHATVTAHLERECRVGGYEAAAEAAERLDRFYPSIADLIGGGPDEIAYVENATRAFDMAFYAVPFREGDRILTAEAEYPSNALAYLQVARRTGAVVEVVPSDRAGGLDVAALERMIDDRVKLIALNHVPTHGGLVNPAAEIGAVARRHGILYLLDACQSVGQIPLDVEAIGCDMLAATGRKYLRGPRGTGFLWVRRARLAELEPPFVDQHAATWVTADDFALREDARRFENWEFYVAGKLGLAAAADYACAVDVAAMWPRIRDLAARLRRELTAVAGVVVRDQGPELCGIVSFTKADEDAADLSARLRTRSINTSVADGPAHFDRHRRTYGAAVRASVHAYNTEDELAQLVGAVADGR
ncbi:MAG: aminotransferase class V-fold PLP-dependent enzyme [Alphaproteobacteria bacterium]|jgi:selenocysteine lyase/cysteine desulfurase|nr:aminotransferase class V-fold PLP-dependent enzyme [Alphaproteobacteria bacterium]